MPGILVQERRNLIWLTRRRDTVMDAFNYSAPCPLCSKRVLDITDPAPRPLTIRLKCPHCHRIIQIPIFLIVQ